MIAPRRKYLHSISTPSAVKKRTLSDIPPDALISIYSYLDKKDLYGDPKKDCKDKDAGGLLSVSRSFYLAQMSLKYEDIVRELASINKFIQLAKDELKSKTSCRRKPLEFHINTSIFLLCLVAMGICAYYLNKVFAEWQVDRTIAGNIPYTSYNNVTSSCGDFVGSEGNACTPFSKNGTDIQIPDVCEDICNSLAPLPGHIVSLLTGGVAEVGVAIGTGINSMRVFRKENSRVHKLEITEYSQETQDAFTQMQIDCVTTRGFWKPAKNPNIPSILENAYKARDIIKKRIKLFRSIERNAEEKNKASNAALAATLATHTPTASATSTALNLSVFAGLDLNEKDANAEKYVDPRSIRIEEDAEDVPYDSTPAAAAASAHVAIDIAGGYVRLSNAPSPLARSLSRGIAGATTTTGSPVVIRDHTDPNGDAMHVNLNQRLLG